MKHPFLKIALLAGATYLVVKAVKKTKEAMKNQAEADDETAEEAVAEELEQPDTAEDND